MRATVLSLFALTLVAQDSSLVKERALGAQIAKEVRTIEIPELLGRIEAIARPLIPADSKFNYTFALEDAADSKEPLALPGGFIFVSTGVIRAVQHTDELAGLLAHAIARVEARPTTKLPGTIPLIYRGGSSGQAVPLGFREVLLQQQLKFDQVAAGIMQSHGYSPSRLADYLERLQPGSPRAAALRRR